MNDYDVAAQLNNVRSELQAIKKLVHEVIGAIRDAESEVPEKMRRFCNYMHDVHDIKYMYEEHGIPVPSHILAEIERLDDRYRQLLVTMNAEGGAFNKIRREMSFDTENRWDHLKHLPKPKENGSETR